MPGIRGFSETNLKMMRIFYEECENLIPDYKHAYQAIQMFNDEYLLDQCRAVGREGMD